jgi:hypothetical protein
MIHRPGGDMDEFVALLTHCSKYVVLGNIQLRDFSIYTCSIFSLYFVVVGKRIKSEECDIL